MIYLSIGKSTTGRWSFRLPIDILTQRSAALGASGSGKTYAAMKIVEEILDKKGQVIIVDTVGNWWGLRLATSGKRAGYSIPILGGERADVPLKPSQGKLTAEMAARTRASMILDVSDFTEHELAEFTEAFSTAFLRAKKRSRSPVLVVWEECQEVVPEVTKSKDIFRAAQAVIRLVKRGRNYGVGTFLISQRSAAVSKEALSQAGTIFAFRTGDARDRKAIADWLTEKQREKVNLVDELPELGTGSCWVYSPSWLGKFDEIAIDRRKTFDSSETPDFSSFKEAGALKPLDLSRFEKDLGETIERAKADDPTHLRAEIARLKREIELNRDNKKIVERSVISDIQMKRIAATIAKVEAIQKKLGEQLVGLRGAISSSEVKLSARDQRALVQLGDQRREQGSSTNGIRPAKTAPRAPVAPVKPASPSDRSLGRCEREILRALKSRHPTPLTRVQAATLAGYSPNSSGYANALSALRTTSLVTGTGDALSITPQGLDAAGDVHGVGDPDQLLILWKNKLPNQESRMLSALVDFENGEGLTRDHLAQYVNLSPTSSGFANYLSHLNSNHLIRKLPDGRIRAADMFLGG